MRRSAGRLKSAAPPLAAPYEAVKDYGLQGTDVQQEVVMAARGSPGLTMGYKVHVDRGVGSWFVPTDVPFFTPSGTVVAAIDQRMEAIVVAARPATDRVASVSGPDFSQGVNLGWLEHDGLDEFIGNRSVTPGLTEGIRGFRGSSAGLRCGGR